MNGSIETYINTKEGNNITFQCDEGFVPSLVMKATCNSRVMWEPLPENHICYKTLDGTIFGLFGIDEQCHHFTF